MNEDSHHASESTALGLGSKDILSSASIDVVDLGLIEYESAYKIQEQAVEHVLAKRSQDAAVPGIIGTIYLLEHSPAVITISRRAGAADHLIASKEHLQSLGIEVRETDRGGDITYHGPGQLVVYPIIDLNTVNLGLHDYMRLLEQSIIDLCRDFGIEAARDPSATGVWIQQDKICAMGVRVRKWISMHGLAINVTTNLLHFGTIVPCGLMGRGVTSLEKLLGDKTPPMSLVKTRLTEHLKTHLALAAAKASQKRAQQLE